MKTSMRRVGRFFGSWAVASGFLCMVLAGFFGLGQFFNLVKGFLGVYTLPVMMVLGLGFVWAVATHGEN